MFMHKRRLATALICAALVTILFGSVSYTPVLAEDNKTAKFHLYATDGYVSMPDGSEMYIWGYSLENKKGTAVYPAPTIEVEEGDQVEITLTNIGASKSGILPLAHTIHFHGLDTNQKNDGVPHTSPPVLVGESFTYQFKAKQAGTYFYHCHVDTVEHLQMGMTGAFIVKAKGGLKQAWTNGPSYDREIVYQMNEMDVSWHEAVANRQSYDRTVFEPDYWTLNGEFLAQQASTSISGKKGETILMRLINSGYEKHTFHMNGRTFKVIATDGRPLKTALNKQTITLSSAERYDLLITLDQDGSYPIVVQGLTKKTTTNTDTQMNSNMSSHGH